jgi:hypothetical protein
VTVATGVPEPTLKVAKVAPVGVAESEDSKNAPDAIVPCLVSAGGQVWRSKEGGTWHCRAGELDMPPTATTLTLPCHKAQARQVPPRARSRARRQTAGLGLGLLPDALDTEREAGATAV